MGLDERVGEDARLDLLDAQRQVERQGGVPVREVPRALGQGGGEFGGVELQQARVGDGLGPQALAHLDHDDALLATHAHRLDDGGLDLGHLLGAELLEVQHEVLLFLGGLEQLDGDLLDLAGGRHRPLADVRVEDAGHFLVGGHLDLEAPQFRPADFVRERGPGARDALLDGRLLLDLDAGQRRQALGPFGLGRPVDADRGGRAHERQHDGLVGRPGGGRNLGSRQQRVDVHLDARLRYPHLPLADRGLRALERHAVLARGLGVRLGEPEREDHRLGGLAFLLDEQLVPALGVGHDAGGLVAQGGLRQGHVAQAQQHFVPALLEDLELDGGLDGDDVLRDGGHAGDLGKEGVDGQFGLLGRGRFVAGGLPEFLELLVRQEHAATFLLEDLAEFRVGDVDALLADGLRLFRRQGRLGLGRGRRRRGRRGPQGRQHQSGHNRPYSRGSHDQALGNGFMTIHCGGSPRRHRAHRP